MENFDKNNGKNPEDSCDKTETINNETDITEYDLKKRKKQFIKFCWQKRSLKKVRPGRIKLLTETKNNEQYASIQCKLWDCAEKDDKWNITTERNELWLENENGKDWWFEFNKPYSYKFSFRIPENFPLSPTRLVIWQWKFNKLDNSDEADEPSPILAQRIKKIKDKNGEYKYYLIITDSHKNQLWEKIPFDKIKGKWVDMEYKINFSDQESVESSVEIIANIEWKKVNIYKWNYVINDDDNKFQLNPKKPHTWYFKFGLYRDNYDYAKKKIEEDGKLSKEDESLWINEIEQAQNSENENPMEIHFKDFSMEDLSYKEFEKEKQQSKIKLLSRIKKLMGKL